MHRPISVLCFFLLICLDTDTGCLTVSLEQVMSALQFVLLLLLYKWNLMVNSCVCDVSL